jgi:hypothetical protein
MERDLLEAKQMMSSRLLRIGFRHNVVAMSRTFRVEAAIAAARRNVHAVGVGRKIVEGKPTDERAIRLYVVQKIAPSLLPPRDRLPETVDGIPTDVIESSPAFFAPRKRRQPRAAKAAATSAAAKACTDKRKKNQRPVLAGISVAHHNVTAGTLGYFCRSLRIGEDPSKIFILSNNHVLADVNQASRGDNIYQPGPADDGTANDHVAELQRFIRIDLDGNPNKVDAAIAELLPNIQWRSEVCSIGAITGTARGVEGMEVRKHGRTTGYTEGLITDESYDALVGMDHNNPNVVGLFQDQIRIETTPPHAAFGLGGDSGSLVVKGDSMEAVGLYFAGPPSGSYGIANQILDVLTEMQIELLTEAKGQNVA